MIFHVSRFTFHTPDTPEGTGGTGVSRFTSVFRVFTQARVIAFLLFLAALLPRLPGLARFLTSDENNSIFFGGSDVIAAFLHGDLRGTYWHFYPGVTMSWLDAVGMAGQYLLDILTGTPVPPFTEYIYGDILSLVVANRLPYAILTAVAVPVTYLLARKLLPERMAVLGALFMAFDPFYLAHSRVAHGDAPLAVFMLLSTLTFFIYIRPASFPAQINERSTRFTTFLTNPYLITSAIFGSLAALTKAPGQFMVIFVVGVSSLYAALEIRQAKHQVSNHISRVATGAPPQVRRQRHASERVSRITHHASRITYHWLTVIIIWGLVSLLVLILLWPSMWVDPLGTIRQMLDETFGKVTEGHLVYFLGQPTLNPGPWFYFYVIPFRLTPIILIGSLLSLLLFIPKIQLVAKHLVTPLLPRALTPLLLLWLFTVTLLLAGNLSPKKQDRYLLPLFPFLDLLAAIGWVGLFDLTYHILKSRYPRYPRYPRGPRWPRWPRLSNLKLIRSLFLISNFSLLILLLLHFIPVLTYYPYYLAYFNPLMGGLPRAVETTLVGWGEGMEQVAAYLNQKPNAETLYVASTPSQTFLPYFKGHGENFYTNDVALRADYVVIYRAQQQRLAPSPEIVAEYMARKPEKVIEIQGVPYAWIYPNTPLVFPDVPPGITLVNIGFGEVLRLAGYHFEQGAGLLEVDLFWHALPAIEHDRGPCYETVVENITATICPRLDYAMSVRLVDAAGDVVAQHDGWPAGGLFPTSQWRINDYVQDHHPLVFPSELPPGDYQLAVVVYEAQSQAVLAGPIEVETVQLGNR